ncbi:unnamed protein product [Choristocarpus tenellus]
MSLSMRCLVRHYDLVRRSSLAADELITRRYGSKPHHDMKDVVDLRSDTVTRPCKTLRAAMAAAEVGDDVYGEDPTVSKLEAYAACVLGKDAAVMVPTGTMANLIAVGTHCRRGDEVVLGDKSHMFLYEGGGASAFLGVAYKTVPNCVSGGVSIEDMKQAVQPDDPHYARTSLLCLENTHNMCGGRVLGTNYMREISEAAHGKGLKVHIDGARLWNAAIALKERPSVLVKEADTISVCLSKGLGAPLGSVLVGDEEFIHEARRLRKSLGGGMRQAGVAAAAGLEALVNNFQRLEDVSGNLHVILLVLLLRVVPVASLSCAPS